MYDPRTLRRRQRNTERPSLRRQQEVGHTRRPLGSGGRGIGNLDIGQWAQSRAFAYGDSQCPPIDRLRSPATGGPPIETLLIDAGVGCERTQYTVSISGAETSDGITGQTLFTRQEILNRGRGVSQLQVRLQYSLGGGRDNQLDLDVGAGFQFSVPATRIQMSLLLPAGAVDLDTSQGQTVPIFPVDPVTGASATFVNQAVLWGTVNRNPGGNISSGSEWQLTRCLIVPSGGIARVDIPEGADFVEAYENSVPAAATPFLRFLTASGLEVGQLSQNFLPAKFYGRSRIPGTAKQIDSGPSSASARFFSVIFTMRP